MLSTPLYPKYKCDNNQKRKKRRKESRKEEAKIRDIAISVGGGDLEFVGPGAGVHRRGDDRDNGTCIGCSPGRVHIVVEDGVCVPVIK